MTVISQKICDAFKFRDSPALLREGGVDSQKLNFTLPWKILGWLAVVVT
jgi:hypothetical protein